MDFYDSISQWYDDIFPLNHQQVSFVLKNSSFSDSRKILDIGCATGSLALELCKHDIIATGVDLDNELLKIAVKKSFNACQHINFRQVDMCNLRDTFSNRKFDTILCLGNTIPHLTNIDEIESFFSDVNSLLFPGGKFIFQIINYDRIIDKKIPSLPTIENEKIKFVRNYYPSQGQRFVNFETILTIKHNGDTITNTIPLLALRYLEMQQIATNIGFKEQNWFGGFDGSPLIMDSLPLIGVLTK